MQQYVLTGWQNYQLLITGFTDPTAQCGYELKKAEIDAFTKLKKLLAKQFWLLFKRIFYIHVRQEGRHLLLS